MSTESASCALIVTFPGHSFLISLLIHIQQLSGDLSGKKVGLVKEGFDTCESDVISLVKDGANKLTQAGAVVEEVSIPMHADGMFTSLKHETCFSSRKSCSIIKLCYYCINTHVTRY